MKGHRYKKGGWYGESYRHYLAAKGIPTGRKRYFQSTALGKSVESFGSGLQQLGDRRRKLLLGEGVAAEEQARTKLFREATETPLTGAEAEELRATVQAVGGPGPTGSSLWRFALAEGVLYDSAKSYSRDLKKRLEELDMELQQSYGQRQQVRAQQERAAELAAERERLEDRLNSLKSRAGSADDMEKQLQMFRDELRDIRAKQRSLDAPDPRLKQNAKEIQANIEALEETIGALSNVEENAQKIRQQIQFIDKRINAINNDPRVVALGEEAGKLTRQRKIVAEKLAGLEYAIDRMDSGANISRKGSLSSYDRAYDALNEAVKKYQPEIAKQAQQKERLRSRSKS